VTPEERQQLQADAVAYIQANLRPDFGPPDLEAGDRLWRAIAAVQYGHDGPREP
jgi:hypothetical protein